MTTETTTPEVTTTPEETSSRQMTFSTLDNGTIRADFGEGIDPLTFNPATDLPEELLPLAVSEGVIARLRSYCSRLSGDARTSAALAEAIKAGMENLRAGTWKVERVAGEGEISQEAEAAYLFRVKRAENKGEKYEGTMSDAAKDFADLSDEKKKQLKAVPLYQLALAEVKAERLAKKTVKLAKKAAAADESEVF